MRRRLLDDEESCNGRIWINKEGVFSGVWLLRSCEEFLYEVSFFVELEWFFDGDKLLLLRFS